MSPAPKAPYVEIHVPNAPTEQEFLRLAVQAAVLKYRAGHDHIAQLQATAEEIPILEQIPRVTANSALADSIARRSL